jgi:4-hydroxy-tetrahydrodipicolinate synthase
MKTKHNISQAGIFVGIIPPLVTPFKADGSMDEKALRSEARYLLNAGVHGLGFGGSTGEGALLSADELATGIQILGKENRGEIPLICGIIRNTTRDAINCGLAARDAGADALMVTPTFYHGTDDQGNISFYREISDSVKLPIIIYNVIDRNPVNPELMLQLSEIEHVIGIKQSVGGLHGLNLMIASCADRISIFGAQDDLLFCSYLLGVDGAISAILTVFPELCVKQWDAVKSGNISEAREIHFRMLHVWRLVTPAGMSFPGRIKAILDLQGRSGGLPRRPILNPSPEIVEQLRSALEQTGFLP